MLEEKEFLRLLRSQVDNIKVNISDALKIGKKSDLEAAKNNADRLHDFIQTRRREITNLESKPTFD